MLTTTNRHSPFEKTAIITEVRIILGTLPYNNNIIIHPDDTQTVQYLVPFGRSRLFDWLQQKVNR